jgi:methionine-rich copper-binding protein CopC
MSRTDDFSANTSTAGRVSLATPGKGNFETGSDVDWYAMTLQAGTRYLFTLTAGGSGPYTYYSSYGLAVYDSSHAVTGNLYGANDPYGRPVLEFAPTVTGTYYVAAISNYASYGLGDYELSAAVRTAADDFSADTKTTGEIGAGATVSGKFEVAGDRDWLKFHAEPGIHYQFSALGPEIGEISDKVFPTTTRIVDAAGNEYSAWSFDTDKGGDFYLSLLGLKAGNYTVVSRTWSDDYSADNTRPGALAPGGQASGKIEYENDVDRFKVSLEAGKFYTVRLGGDADYYNMVFYDASGERIDYQTGNTMYGEMSYTFAPAISGDVYIQVGAMPLTRARTGVVNYYVGVSTGTDDDIGNTAFTATRTAVGDLARGVLQIGSDIDAFKVALEAGKTYSFALTGAGAGQGYHYIRLTGSDGIDQKASGANLAGYTFTPARSGDYTVAVGSDGGVTPNWAYELAITVPADDAGAAVGSAGTLTLATPKSGALEAGGGDRDWYAIKLTAGTTYWFTAESASSTLTSGGQLRILDASGQQLGLAGATSYGTLADTLSFRAPQSTTYYVEISSPQRNVGAYTLTAKVGINDDHGGTAATATALTPGAAALTGKLEIGSDKDTFKLNVTAGVTYGLKFNMSGNYSSQFGLVDSAGKEIATSYYSGIPSNLKLFTATETGTVFATVSSGFYYADVSNVSYTLAAIDYGKDDYARAATTTATLPMNGQLQAGLDYPGDGDWVRVKLEAGKSYVFSMLDTRSGGGTLAGPSTSYYKFSLSDGSSYPLLGAARADAVESRISFTATKTGDYYLHVNAEYGAMGSFTLKAAQLTGDSSGPALTASSHANGASNVALNATFFKLSFSEAIAIDATGIKVLDESGNVLNFSYMNAVRTPRVNDNTLEFKVEGYLKPGSYTVVLPRGAVLDLAGNAYGGPETIKFTTVQPAAAPTAGNDLLAGGGGTPINGGAGVDTIVYDGQLYQYTIKRIGDKVTVLSQLTGKTDTLENVERLLFGQSAFALDANGNGGQAYRLYKAAFHRMPDQDGLGFWMGQLDHGLSLNEVAGNFMASAEFQSLYGAAPSNQQFINLLYTNVLGRAADSGGFSFWDGALQNGSTREQVLTAFSESAENVAALVGTIGNGFFYTLY